MSDRYSATGFNSAMAATFKTCLDVVSSTLTRGRIEKLIINASGTPADNAIEWIVSKRTAAGTGTPVTPVAFDNGAPAAQLSANENYTAEPTVTANSEMFHNEINQRATFTLVLAPGSEWIVPAVADNGFVVRALHASYTGAFKASMAWYE